MVSSKGVSRVADVRGIEEPFLNQTRRRCFAGVVKRVIAGLLDMNLLQASRRKVLEDPVYLHTQILRRRDLVRKTVKGIQIRVIKPVEQICLRKGIQLAEVANHSGRGIDLTAQCHLHRVIMAVTVRVVALAEDYLVL